MAEFIYLDNNATTRPDPAVIAAMLPFLTDHFGNASSPHQAGSRAKRALGMARRNIAQLLNAKASEIIFTSSATEANHMALIGGLKAMAQKTGRRKLITTAIEHPSSLALTDHLAHMGFVIVRLPATPDGIVPVDAFEEHIDDDTAMVSLMWANNETGVLQPVEAVAALAQKHGALYHCDAVQAVGKIPTDVTSLPVDFLTFSGHKIHGPKGIGALYLRKGVDCHPLLWGGQEGRRRGGTENVPAIVGFGMAAALAQQQLSAWTEIEILRNQLEMGLLNMLPASHINGGQAQRTPNCSNITFKDDYNRPLEAEALLTWLDREGICVSMGSACQSGDMAPSSVLQAMGLEAAEALASLRFSLSLETSRQEVEQVLTVLTGLVAKLAA